MGRLHAASSSSSGPSSTRHWNSQPARSGRAAASGGASARGVESFTLTTDPRPFPCTLRPFIRLLGGHLVAAFAGVSGVLLVQTHRLFVQLGASDHDKDMPCAAPCSNAHLDFLSPPAPRKEQRRPRGSLIRDLPEGKVLSARRTAIPRVTGLSLAGRSTCPKRPVAGGESRGVAVNAGPVAQHKRPARRRASAARLRAPLGPKRPRRQSA